MATSAPRAKSNIKAPAAPPTLPPYRVLLFSADRLNWPGGMNFLEQELTRGANGGYTLKAGLSGVDPRPRWWGLSTWHELRFVFEPPTFADSTLKRPDWEFGCFGMALRGRQMSDETAVAREATERLSERAHYGYELVEALGWDRYWLFVLQRPYNHTGGAQRYELRPYPRAIFERTNPPALEGDHRVVRVLTSGEFVYPITLISKGGTEPVE